MTILAERQEVILGTMGKIQNAMRPTTSNNTQYEPRRYKTVDDFEAFCERIQTDKEIRDGYVRVQIFILLFYIWYLSTKWVEGMLAMFVRKGQGSWYEFSGVSLKIVDLEMILIWNKYLRRSLYISKIYNCKLRNQCIVLFIGPFCILPNRQTTWLTTTARRVWGM